MSVTKYKTIPQMLRSVSTQVDMSNAYNMVYNEYQVNYSSLEFYYQVSCFSLALDNLGVKANTGIGILANSSPKWVMSDFACQILRIYSIPLFLNLSEENFSFEIENGDIQYLFLDNINNIPDNLKSSLHKIKGIVCLEKSTNKKIVNPSSIVVKNKHIKIQYLDELLKIGQNLHAKDPKRIDQLIDAVKEDDIATIVYTSGSTGTPKGVIITHFNLCHQLYSLQNTFKLFPREDRAMSVLPLAHIFQRTITYLYIASSVFIYFSDDIKNLSTQIKIIKPHIIIVVPRILKKIYTNATINAQTSPFFLRPFLSHAINSARKRSNHTENSFACSFDKILYGQIRRGLGGALRIMVCGGAALHPKVNKFFANIGIPVYQGYGMTEHSPVISTNIPGRNQLGSVGKAIEGVEIKISNDGEILAKSKSMMKGYYKDSEYSKTILMDGWLHTGDLGYLDENDFLFITGRKKDLHKTSTGKYVSPAPIEMSLAHSRMIQYALVIADDRNFASALIFIDEEYINSIPHVPYYFKIHKIPQLKDRIQKIIDNTNKHLNDWERIKKFKIVNDFASVENNMLTPTLKLRRHYVENKYSDLIESIYKDSKKKSDFI